MKRVLLAAILFVPLALVICVSAADWPQWRGPKRDGLSAETGLLKEWPAEGPKLLWQVKDIGEGYSTPAVVGQRVYLINNRKDEEFVEARGVKDGNQIWSVSLGKVGRNRGPQYPGSRSTTTIDGDTLFALSSDGDLAAMATADGAARWQKNLKSDFGGKPGAWAYAESPLVDGDRVVVTPGGADATLVALDKKSGEVIWKAQVPGGDESGYSSVIIVNAGGSKQYVQFMQKGLVGVDAATGKFLWRYDKTASGSPANIPTPVAHDGYIYSGAGRSGGGLVKLKVAPDGIEAEEVYFTPKLPTSIGGSVLVGEYLYGTNGQGLLCADFATGDIKWQERGVGAGAVCYADGRLYVHGEKGEVALVDASADAYHERGRFTPPEGPDRGRSAAWAYPVVADGKLYIRDLGSLWCYDVKNK